MRRRTIWRGLPLLALFLLTVAGCVQKIDETDYQAVGEDFILRNGNIARILGKVERLDHFGAGGGGGDVSYNVYRVYGTGKTAVCNLTLRREGNRWRVSEASLTIEGQDYRLPIQRSSVGRALRLMK